MSTRRILIAVDGSEGSRAALREGLGLAAALRAAVTLVSVTRPPSAALGHPYYEHTLGRSLRRAREGVSQALAEAESAGITADYELLEGDAATEIVALAHMRGVDMIVIGSRGLGTVAGALLGSVSRHVLQHAGVPVLVVRDSNGAAGSRAA